MKPGIFLFYLSDCYSWPCF